MIQTLLWIQMSDWDVIGSQITVVADYLIIIGVGIIIFIGSVGVNYSFVE
jgi:hypothetical protein